MARGRRVAVVVVAVAVAVTKRWGKYGLNGDNASKSMCFSEGIVSLTAKVFASVAFFCLPKTSDSALLVFLSFRMNLRAALCRTYCTFKRSLQVFLSIFVRLFGLNTRFLCFFCDASRRILSIMHK